MAINLATLTPASVKAKNVATEDYVDTSTDGMLTDSNFNTNITTIDGGKITTGSIGADQIAANTITADKIQSVYINGYTIEGAVIRGASIEGSVIKSSWIDYTTTGDLTNWQYYTTSTIPSAYEANFAHDNVTGALIVDSLGYVRLVGQSTLYSNIMTETISTAGLTGNATLQGTLSISDGVCSYDMYTISTNKRTVSLAPHLSVSTKVLVAKLLGTTYQTVMTDYVQFSVHGNTVKMGVLAPNVTLWINGVAQTTLTRDYNNLSDKSYSFSVAGIGFTMELSSATGAYGCLYIVSGNTQLPEFRDQKSYYIGNFSYYVSRNEMSAGMLYITFPSITFTL